MSRKDFYHTHAKDALIKDGWDVKHDPLPMPFANTVLKIDLGAERLTATKDNETITVETIAVEVKDFLRPTKFVSEFHKMLGQCDDYSFSLSKYDPNRKLYVAITEDAYNKIFSIPDIAAQVINNNIRLIVFNPYIRKIVSWKK